MEEKDITLSLVDDDGSVRTALKRLLNALGFNVKTFKSSEDFLDSGLFHNTNVLILDVRMPGMSGLELQKRLIEMNSELPVIFVTAHDDVPARMMAMEAGAVAFLQKPCEERDLVNAIDRALGRERNKMAGKSAPSETGDSGCGSQDAH
jgi:two-component system, LuxR family, response regulator FixJ